MDGLFKPSSESEAPSLSQDLSFDFLQGMTRFSVLNPGADNLTYIGEQD